MTAASPFSRRRKKVTKRSVTLWLARSTKGRYDEYQVFINKPKLVGKETFYSGHLADPENKRDSMNNGAIVDLCRSEVRRTLGLRLDRGECVPITISFGRVVKAKAQQGS